VLAFFGPLSPDVGIFDITRASIVANQGRLEVLLATDQPVAPAPNLHVVNSSLDDMRNRLHTFLKERADILDAPVPDAKNLLPKLRKMCDMKVIYNELFKSEVKARLKPRPRDFLGYGDLDLVYGNVSGFLEGGHQNKWKRVALDAYDVLGVHGHMTALRYPLWQTLKVASQPWVVKAMIVDHYTTLDEGRFRRFLLLKAGVLRGEVEDLPDTIWQSLYPNPDNHGYWIGSHADGALRQMCEKEPSSTSTNLSVFVLPMCDFVADCSDCHDPASPGDFRFNGRPAKNLMLLVAGCTGPTTEWSTEYFTPTTSPNFFKRV
jgi:hypothetical protein